MEGSRSFDLEFSNHRQERKRTHERMTGQSEGVINPPLLRSYPPSSSLARNFPAPLYAPLGLYPGNGFDFRRPVMSSDRAASSTNVIDLTGDSDDPPTEVDHQRSSRRRIRGGLDPQYFQEVIDLEAQEALDIHGLNGGYEGGTVTEPRIRSPELELLGVQSLPSQIAPPVRESGWSFQGGNGSTNRGPVTGIWSHVSDILTYGPLELFGSRSSMSDQSNLPGHLFPGFVSRTEDDPGPNAEIFGPPMFRTRSFQPPGLDYEAISFQVGPEPPQRHTCRPPSPPRPGFTRSPQEDDVLVCPNCDEELGVGEDGMKQQVWVVKSCGHVYCGQCARNRTKRSKRDRPEMSKPFSKCVVEGCGKAKTSGAKSMIQLYI